MKKIIYIIVLLAISYTTFGQKFGNNPGSLNANAVVELESTNKGLLLPRVALTSSTSFLPLAAHVVGMKVYNTATAGIAPNNVTPGEYYNNGSKWIKVQPFAEPEPDLVVVYVSTTNPNTGGTLFYAQPQEEDDNGNIIWPVAPDATLALKETNVYVGTNASTWRYSLADNLYTSYNVVPTTAFYLNKTEIDAVGNKISPIERSGQLTIRPTAESLTGASFLVQNLNAPRIIGGRVGQYGVQIMQKLLAQGTGNNLEGLRITNELNFNAGVTDASANVHGIRIYSWKRSGLSTTTNSGSSANLNGIRMTYGHNGSIAGNPGTTTNVRGLYLSSQAQFGTIVNMYDIKVDDSNTNGTVTNSWGLHLEGANKRNYFQGSLGLGIDVPTYKLEVAAENTKGFWLYPRTGTTGSPILRVTGRQDSTNNSQVFGAMIALDRVRQTGGQITPDAVLGSINFGGYHTTAVADDSNTRYSAAITATASETFSSINNMGIHLNFRTGNVGTDLTTAATNTGNIRMRITDTGNVGINTIAPTEKLEVSSGTAGDSGMKLTNLPSAILGTDATGKIIDLGSSPTTGVTVNKILTQDAIPASSALTTWDIFSDQLRFRMRSSGNFLVVQVRLVSLPATNVILNFNKFDIATSSSSSFTSLTFTAANFSAWQTVHTVSDANATLDATMYTSTTDINYINRYYKITSSLGNGSAATVGVFKGLVVNRY